MIQFSIQCSNIYYIIGRAQVESKKFILYFGTLCKYMFKYFVSQRLTRESPIDTLRCDFTSTIHYYECETWTL